MTIAISGISGFVGSYLQNYFEKKMYKVIPIERSILTNEKVLANLISEANVIINLAGANILQRWNKKHKKLMYDSRINTTKALVKAINKNKKEQLFISTSAIGIYANDILCDEEQYVFGDGFLAQLCQDWEQEARQVKKRMAIFRFSIILGDGGALKKMLFPFKLGLGGKIGSGEQPFSYIHINDLARTYALIIRNQNLEGIFNLSTPNPSTNGEFSTVLARTLHRPSFFPVPALILKLIFGEGAQVLLNGQCVYPKRLIDNAFQFCFPTVKSVLDDLILGNNPR